MRSLRIWLVAGLIISVTAAVYARVGGFDFVDYDDPAFITRNPHVQNGITPASLRWAMGAVVVANWHPATMLSHLLDVQLFGVRPGPMHLVNLAFHIANAVLLLMLLLRLTGELWQSALVAGLFALHPLHVESVAWISERKDVLSTFFFLLTLLAYAQYARRRRWGWFILTLLVFGVGLMSKPMLVTLPGVLLLLDFWPLERKEHWGRLLLEKVPFALLAMGDAVLTFLLQRKTGAVSSLTRIPFGLRVENAIVSSVRYLGDMVWPAKLSVFYPYPSHIPAGVVLLCAAILVLLTWLAWRQRHRRPKLLMGWLWYGLTLLPVIGLVQVGDQARADRYTYIPSIGIFIAVAWTLGSFATSALSRGACSALAIIVLALLGWRTWVQTSYWQNSRTLWTHAEDVTQGNWLAWNHLATLDANRGDLNEARRLAEQVIQVRPAFAEGHFNLGNVLMKTGDVQAALSEFRQALQLKPDLAEAHNNLGRALMMVGRIEPAIEQFQLAVSSDPDNPDWQRNLATALRYRTSATRPSPTRP